MLSPITLGWELRMTQIALDTLALTSAEAIYQVFDAYHRQFKEITHRAKSRFETCEWRGTQQDMVERLELRTRIVNQAVDSLKACLGPSAEDEAVWVEMKRHYTSRVTGRPDRELAETFFNSIIRRILTIVGVKPEIEYVDFDFDAPLAQPKTSIYKQYFRKSNTAALIKEILADYAFSVPYYRLDQNVVLIVTEVEAHLAAEFGHRPVIDAAEMIKPVFYRNKGAYIVGRLRIGSQLIPLALALLHVDQGLIVDTVLLTDDDLSIVFSFTRSYFHVEVEEPRGLVTFLKSIIPLKRIAELYISIGYYKHGKTELYRDLRRHLEQSKDRFEIAQGERGMVMTVFTLPSYDMVFKIIKDRFAHPKKTTREKVMGRYQMVFKHDRAGRLIDAQEFEHLTFERARFSPALIEELLEVAAGSVTVTADTVDIKHLYIERRLTPLNLYIKNKSVQAVREAVLDCGQTIKDLAATNIFPGDFLLKNFGVTRHGRVVFYDYDELCFLTDCVFRQMPQARSFEDEFESQPWFSVEEGDIFPEEFKTFLGLPTNLMAIFAEAHRDLFGVSFWQNMQTRHRAGETIDLFPYKESQRLLRRLEG